MKYFILLITIMTLSSCNIPQHYIPQPVHATGEYRQESTGVIFPEQLQNFLRAEIIKYDENGTNISAGYNHTSKQIALTLYSYPAPHISSFGSPQNVIDTAKQNLFLNAYAQNKNEIMHIHQNCKLITESNYKLTQGIAILSGSHALFTYTDNFAGTRQEVSSELYLFQVGNSLFKYRITYPININAENEITQFLRSFILHEST